MENTAASESNRPLVYVVETQERDSDSNTYEFYAVYRDYDRAQDRATHLRHLLDADLLYRYSSVMVTSAVLH
jgi:hypothetical protein